VFTNDNIKKGDVMLYIPQDKILTNSTIFKSPFGFNIMEKFIERKDHFAPEVEWLCMLILKAAYILSEMNKKV
jgi:hypothetical protein